MPLPVIPIGILWIVGAAATIGVLGGLVAFFATNEATFAILGICFAFIVILLIPFLPNRFKLVRDFKRKLRLKSQTLATKINAKVEENSNLPNKQMQRTQLKLGR